MASHSPKYTLVTSRYAEDTRNKRRVYWTVDKLPAQYITVNEDTLTVTLPDPLIFKAGLTPVEEIPLVEFPYMDLGYPLSTLI